jgi:hypothetical protein
LASRQPTRSVTRQASLGSPLGEQPPSGEPRGDTHASHANDATSRHVFRVRCRRDARSRHTRAKANKGSKQQHTPRQRPASRPASRRVRRHHVRHAARRPASRPKPAAAPWPAPCARALDRTHPSTRRVLGCRPHPRRPRLVPNTNRLAPHASLALPPILLRADGFFPFPMAPFARRSLCQDASWGGGVRGRPCRLSQLLRARLPPGTPARAHAHHRCWLPNSGWMAGGRGGR